MKKIVFSLFILNLTFLGGAFAASTAENSQALLEYVQKNLSRIEREGAKQLGYTFMSLDRDSLECLGTLSFASKAIGTCLATGDLDWPNSSSDFAINVSQDDAGEHRKMTVTLLSTEQ